MFVYLNDLLQLCIMFIESFVYVYLILLKESLELSSNQLILWGMGGEGCFFKKMCCVSLLRQTYWSVHLELQFLGCGGKGGGALNNMFLFSIFLNTNWSLLYRIKFKDYVYNDTFAYDMYQGYFIEKNKGDREYIFCLPLHHNLTSIAPPPHNFIFLDVTLTTPSHNWNSFAPTLPFQFYLFGSSSILESQFLV